MKSSIITYCLSVLIVLLGVYWFLAIGGLNPKNKQVLEHLESISPSVYPGKFAEYLAKIQGLNHGHDPYPAGYRFEELRKAKLANAKRGTTRQLDWIERGPGNVGGRTRSILIDPKDKTLNTFYVGSVSGGLWKAHRTVDASGQESIEWTSLTDQLPNLNVSAMGGASEKYPDVIYVGTGERHGTGIPGDGIYKTTDGGRTWTHLRASLVAGMRFISSLVVDPDNPDVLVVGSGGIWRSEDGGESFSRVGGFNDTFVYVVSELRAKPDDFSVQFAVSTSTILRSTDAGKTWKESLTISGGANGYFSTLAISQSHSENVWAAGVPLDPTYRTKVYRSMDTGESWKEIEMTSYKSGPLCSFVSERFNVWNYAGRQGYYNNTIAVHPFSPDTVYLGGICTVKSWLLTDTTRFAEFWNNHVNDVHVDHHVLETIPIDESANEFHVLNGNDGGFAYSRDGGESWTEGDIFPGFNTSQFYDATKRLGYSQYIGGMQDNGTWTSDEDPDSKSDWRFEYGGDGFDVIWKGDDSLMATWQYGQIIRSLDGGRSWINVSPFGTGPFWTTLEWTGQSGDVVFTINEGLHRTLDFGGSWHLISDPIPDSTKGLLDVNSLGGFAKISLADPNVVWAGWKIDGEGRLHVSENALNPLPGEGVRDPFVMRQVGEPGFFPQDALFIPISGIGTHPHDRATAYVTLGISCYPKLIRTEDIGQTWKDLSGFENPTSCQSTNGFPDVTVFDVAVLPEAPNIIWAVTDIGIVESRDNGDSWAYADNGLPPVLITGIRIIDNEAVVATYGRGVWTLDLSQIRVDNELIAEVPASFELLENYPNPFNPSTTIRFKLAIDSHVRVSVFDVLGRKIATLTDDSYTSGTHEITWDASALSSGQYFYRLEADGKLIGAKAMLLLK